MEFKIKKYEKPDVIEFNFEELKNEIKEKVSYYATLAYDESQIKEAKADRSSLNKLKKALNDERLRIQREYMEPFNGFKAQVDELISVIDEPVGVIDKQIKEYDDRKKIEKTEKIREEFEKVNTTDFLKLDQIWNPKWLNATYTFAKISQEIEEAVKSIKTDLLTLASLDAYAFEAQEHYKTDLNMTAAIQETKRLAEIQKKKEEANKQREEAERQRIAEQEKRQNEKGNAEEEAVILPEQTMEPERIQEPIIPQTSEEVGEWIRFEAFLTVSQAKDLKWFFETKNIDFKAI